MRLVKKNQGVALIVALVILVPLTLIAVVREFNFEVRHSPMPPDGTLRIP